jgi:nicotinamide riboside transporter PnuC
MIALIGYAAFGLNIVGNILLAHKSIFGWVVRLVTNVVWVAYAVQVDGGEPMLLNHLTFFGINIYGWWNWRRTT